MKHKLKKYFFSGLVVFLPIALTLYLFIWALNFSDGLLGRYIKPVFIKELGFYFKGLSLLITISVVFLCGFVVTNYLGRKLHAYFENLILRLPLFRQVYSGLKEIALFIFSKEKMNFQTVVLVEYPRKGLFSPGYLTNPENEKVGDILKRKICNVFIPTSPTPFSGFLIHVPAEDVIVTDITIEEAMKMIVSGGVMNPKFVVEVKAKNTFFGK